MSGVESSYAVRARLWKWSGGKAAWFFITLPARVSREIRLVDAGPTRRGFGSLRTEATIGGSTWSTSVFPSSELKAYLLPVKASVRRAEKLVEGKMVSLTLKIRRAG
jgi:hypothetical protein